MDILVLYRYTTKERLYTLLSGCVLGAASIPYQDRNNPATHEQYITPVLGWWVDEVQHALKTNKRRREIYAANPLKIRQELPDKKKE